METSRDKMRLRCELKAARVSDISTSQPDYAHREEESVLSNYESG